MVERVKIDLQGSKCRLTKDIGHGSHCFNEVKRGTGVKSTGRIVEAQDTRPGGHHLGNTHSFPFTSGDTTNEFVSNVSLSIMGDIEHLE